ncbi:flagellar filament capping protein FliD [Undibacterium sp. TJN19]|uniref:flagellar filament capping protein FliD n=1 Tax=Undibacterium sp. TJN19 TaxID=3413055 RepID=UPI003BF32834
MAGIQSTGIGSNLDVNGIVSKLMQVESQPLTLLATKEASYQAKLSAYGSLSSAVSAFQSALTSLNTPSTFQSLNASSGDSTIAFATANSSATAGSYNVAVTKLAQAQGLSSAGQVNSTDAIGTGTETTISFEFGTITGTATNGVYPGGTTFQQDPNQTVGTVKINSTNNSLQGIRDAINSANIGVSASIVGDGSATPYHLVLNSSKTGAASSIKITSSGEDAAVTSLLANDPAGTQHFTEVSTAQNASLTVNGIAISSASNTVLGAIQGVSLTVSKVGTTSISVSPNTTGIQAGVTSFVKAYNDLNSTIKSLTAYDATTNKAGLLLGDSTTQSIQNQIRKTLSSSVNGLGGGLTTLSQIGVSFQKDGSIALDASKLSSALATKFSDVGGLFASIGSATDSLASITGSSSTTKAGSYDLAITQIATKSKLTGDLTLPATTTIDPNTKISVTLDGVVADVSLAAGNYTPTDLATLIQSSINSTSAFSSVSATAKASIVGGALVLESNKFGSTSAINVANQTGTGIALLTGSVVSGTSGVDVAGTLNGITATGNGQVLSGASGSPADGLKLLVAGGSTGARGTVNFSVGYATQLSGLLSGFIGSSGTITSTTAGVNSSIKDIGKQRDVLNSRLFDIEARYRAQFTALDSIVSSLNNTSTFLTQQLAALSGSK